MGDKFNKEDSSKCLSAAPAAKYSSDVKQVNFAGMVRKSTADSEFLSSEKSSPIRDPKI